MGRRGAARSQPGEMEGGWRPPQAEDQAEDGASQGWPAGTPFHPR